MYPEYTYFQTAAFEKLYDALVENKEPKESEIVEVFKTFIERIKDFLEDTIFNILMADSFFIQLSTFSFLKQYLIIILFEQIKADLF